MNKDFLLGSLYWQRQALNNQAIYSYLTEVDKLLDSNCEGSSDGYFAKQVFSGDDR